MRNLQARGLHEAAEVLGIGALHDVAASTEGLATAWEALSAEHDLDALASAVRALHSQEVETVENLKALLL